MTGEPAPERESGPGIAAAAFGGCCPRCGKGKVFAGVTRFADACTVCGLDLTRFNVGDGPAAFLTLIIGAVITGLGIALDQTLHPPFWVHILLWIPLTVAAVIYGLRIAKAALLAAEYRRDAGEGRLKK